MKMKNVVKKQHGFTLLELVVVVAVLGLIASMATEFVSHETNQTRFELTKEKRAVLRTAVSEFYQDCREFPDQLSDLVIEPSPPCSGTWGGPYLLDVEYEHCKDSDGNNLTGYPRPVYRDGWGNGYCELSSSARFENYGWDYDKAGSSEGPTLVSLGLDMAIGPNSASSAESNYEYDYPPTSFPLITSGALADVYSLKYTASGSVGSLLCVNGSGASVAIANCQAN